MVFNHYAKIKRILVDHPDWYIVRINQKTVTKNFKGEEIQYSHYFRIYEHNKPIKYCKFQQLELLAKTLHLTMGELELKILKIIN